MDMEYNIPKIFQEVKAIIKEDACMKFYNETKPLYIGPDASGVRLGQRRGTATLRETLSILYVLEKFHHNCFVREVSIMPYQNPLFARFKKGVATLSQRLQ